MTEIGTKLDAAQVVKQAYDEPNRRIRVDAVVNASIADVKIEDQDGNLLEVNPDGSINTNITNALDLELSAADGDNVAISDGSNVLAVNADGTINVNTVNNILVTNIYSEVTSVVSGIPTTILNYTLSDSKKLELVSVSGTNIAMYELMINNSVVAKKYTNFNTPLNIDFNMKSLGLLSGQNIKVVVTHNRPSAGDFNSNILLKG
jgi:hypothetical protein